MGWFYAFIVCLILRFSMHTSSLLARKITRWVSTPMEAIVIGVLNGTFVVRLSSMQLEGLPAFGGGTLALSVAITSLMFNRARSYPDGPLQRRTLVAAELCFRATLSLILGAASTAMIFPFVVAAGFQPTPMDRFPTQLVPIVCTAIPAIFVLLGSLLLLRAAHFVLPSMLGNLTARRVSSSLRKLQK